MNKEEIFRYIKVGKNKSISVNTCLLKEYPGIIRRVIIRQDGELQIDYLDKYAIELGEGEISFYFYYEDYKKLFFAVENLTGSRMDNWVRYEDVELNCSTSDIDLIKSWEKLKIDFVAKKLTLPTGYKKYAIRDIYWEALDSGDIKVSDSIEVFHKWLEKKMIQDEEYYRDI